MAMENCDIRYEQEYKTFATKNLTRAALEAVFGLNNLNISGVWLKDSSDTYIFPDEQGMFPTLEEFGTYDVEVCLAGRKRQQDQSSDENSSDDDLFRSYKSASTSGKKARKGSTLKKKKGKGPRAVPGPSGMSTESWYFKVTIGEINPTKKITPLKNCLIKCNPLTTCTTVKEEIAKEMAESPYSITLYDSDFLKIEDSPGRVGKYWYGSRKVFAVINTNGSHVTATSTCTSNTSISPQSPPPSHASTSIDNMLTTLTTMSTKLEGIEKSLQKVQAFVTKGPENIYKDVTIFTRDMLKCPICCYVTKDEIPHATSCCNSVFCRPCMDDLAARSEQSCPLCKQRRGPLYPIMVSGIQELSRKVAIIPEETD